MFKENNEHLKQSVFTSLSHMNNAVQKKLMNSWASVFYHVVFCGIDEKIFSVLYCNNNGRPNFPVNILLSLEYIKHLFNYSDVELVEQFCFNYQVNYALGMKNVGEINLAPGTLYEFRKRLYQYAVENPEKGDLIFSQFVELTKEFVKKSGTEVNEQRMDSTMISANIKNAGRLALAYDVLVQAIKLLPEKKLTESLKEVMVEGYKNKLLYQCKTNQTMNKLEELLNKCLTVSELITSSPEIQKLQGMIVLERFINEQTELDKDTKKRVIKKTKILKQIHCSQHMTKMQHTEKKEKRKTEDML